MVKHSEGKIDPDTHFNTVLNGCQQEFYKDFIQESRKQNQDESTKRVFGKSRMDLLLLWGFINTRGANYFVVARAKFHPSWSDCWLFGFCCPFRPFFIIAQTGCYFLAATAPPYISGSKRIKSNNPFTHIHYSMAILSS